MIAPFDVAILSPDGTPFAARLACGEWLSLRHDAIAPLARTTIETCERIARGAHGFADERGYTVIACPTSSSCALALLCGSVLASHDALARGMLSHARAHAALAMMLAVAASQAGADDATIAACGAAARGAMRSAAGAPLSAVS